MEEDNTVNLVPKEAIQQHREAAIPVVNAAIDSGHSEDDSEDKYSGTSSSFYERRNRRVFERTFKPKLIALGAAQNVVFDDVINGRPGWNSHTFRLTMLNSPAGAPWNDGVQALVRIDIVGDADPRFLDHPAGADVIHTFDTCQFQLDEGSQESERPVAVSSDSSAISCISGDTLLDELLGYLDGDEPSVGDRSHHFDDDDDDNSMSLRSDDPADWSDVGREESPDEDQWWRLDEALVQNLLQDHDIPVPRTLAYDVSTQNALGFAYSIHTLLPGDSVLETSRNGQMSLKDRLWLAGEIAEIRARLETIRFQGSGRLLADEDEHSSAGRLPLRMSSRADITETLKLYGFVKGSGWTYGRSRQGESQPVWKSLYHLILNTAEDLIKSELRGKSNEPRIRRYLFMKDMIHDMDLLGWFSETDKSSTNSVLNYWHHDADKTFVERTNDPSSPWRLTGLTGWESPEALPPILTRTPSAWLWHYDDTLLPKETRLYWEGDVDWLPLDLSHMTADDMAVKQRFEDVLIEKLYTPQYRAEARYRYLADTYGRGRWLRRIYRFAQEGITHDRDFMRFNVFIREWNEYMEEKNIQYEDLDLWDGAREGPKEGPRMYVPGIKYIVNPELHDLDDHEPDEHHGLKDRF
ncbi:hypothetical protein D6C77_04956 [Aureobasidium pullulans]|nr:hypothetical protein D6C77_04956 [Aureobasidium pullulans]